MTARGRSSGRRRTGGGGGRPDSLPPGRRSGWEAGSCAGAAAAGAPAGDGRTETRTAEPPPRLRGDQAAGARLDREPAWWARVDFGWVGSGEAAAWRGAGRADATGAGGS
ncbi:unnamed protein product [Ectocarpus sp. 12 AP-2014]